MNKSNKNKPSFSQAKPFSASTEKKRWPGFKPSTSRWLTYGIGFLLLFVLLTWGYGDVFARTEQDSYITSENECMYFLTSQPLGWVYWCARWLLLTYKWVWLGGLFLAAVYTLTARLADRALCLPRQWEGVGFVLPVAQMAWVLWRGINIYYKNEPSLFMVLAVGVLIASAVLALVSWIITRKRKKSVGDKLRPWGALIAALLLIGTTASARYFNENEILTARLQLMQWEQDWDGMIQEARSAKLPTRAVAAYHAIALEETDQLLEGMYDIPYEFPIVRIDSTAGVDEYRIFNLDANFHAGLINASYRAAMDELVCNGPRIYSYKRLALCALLNKEKQLCQKYLTLLKQTPFEGAFVEKYSAMLKDEKLIKEDPELAHVMTLAPIEENFEQNYRQPIFLGYNYGLNSGTDAALITSAAACLYAKDLNAFLLRAQVLAQKGKPFPACMQQAIAIMGAKDENLLKAFPQVQPYVSNEILSFLMDAKPYAKDRLKLRHEMRKQWLGTYVYYYYTENNDPDQIVKTMDKKAEVN